jgi:transposase
MKGSIGVSCRRIYSGIYLPPKVFKLAYYNKLSEKAKTKFKAINLYNSGRYKIDQICEIFEIDRTTFYRWRKSYNPQVIQTLEDKSKRPKRTRGKVVRDYPTEHLVCNIRRKYPYFGKEKIKRILERDHNINISVSSVGRILTQYQSILPRVKAQTKRIKILKKNRIRIKQVKKDMKGTIAEWLQGDTIELNLRFIKIYIFSAIDPISKILYMRAYRKASSVSGRDFLLRLQYLHEKRTKYIQLDNGSEFEKYFEKEAKRQNIILVHNYPKSPKMNCFVEKVNDTIQNEYLDRFYEETSIKKINDILYECLIEYNFFRPHRSLNLLTPIEYCQRLLFKQTPRMLQMYRTQSIL